MSSLNRCTIIGRLGQDVEIRNTQSGTAVATLSVATSEKYKDKSGELIEKTQWHRIVAWGRLAEICQQYLKKGSLAYFEGPIETREWEDKEGVKRYTTEIKALNMQMLDSKGGSDSSPRANPAPAENPAVNLDDDFDDMDDSLPF